jgi:cytochrome c biogenesis factor
MSTGLLLFKRALHFGRRLMKLRLALTVIVVIIYVGLFNLYIYDLTKIDIRASKLFYNYLTLSALIFFLLDIKSGFVSFIHKQFNLILILCVIINYVIIILTHHTILQNPKPMFWAFNGSVFAVTLIIGSSILRHGYQD